MFLKKISWQKPFNFTARPIKLKIMMSSLIWYPTCNCNSHSFEVIFNFQYLKNAVSHTELPKTKHPPPPKKNTGLLLRQYPKETEKWKAPLSPQRQLAENSNQRKKAIDFHAFSHSTNRSSESPNVLQKREKLDDSPRFFAFGSNA